MARARPRRRRRLSEIGEVILAEWYRVLPEKSGDPVLPMDPNALSAAFNNIVEAKCIAVLDNEPGFTKILVPWPPATSRDELDEYMRKNSDFISGMGVAALFGCGR